MKPKPEKMPRGSRRQFTARKTEHSGQMWALGRGLGPKAFVQGGGRGGPKVPSPGHPQPVALGSHLPRGRGGVSRAGGQQPEEAW